MQVPQMLEGDSPIRLVQGVIAGAVVTILVGFYWGGWVLGSTAKTMAANAADQALAPICAEQFRANPEAVAKLDPQKSWSTSAIVREYIKKVGNREMDYAFANKCADELAKTPSSR